jgi:hypothetical protein
MQGQFGRVTLELEVKKRKRHTAARLELEQRCELAPRLKRERKV